MSDRLFKQPDARAGQSATVELFFYKPLNKSTTADKVIADLDWLVDKSWLGLAKAGEEKEVKADRDDFWLGMRVNGPVTSGDFNKITQEFVSRITDALRKR